MYKMKLDCIDVQRNIEWTTHKNKLSASKSTHTTQCYNNEMQSKKTAQHLKGEQSVRIIFGDNSPDQTSN